MDFEISDRQREILALFILGALLGFIALEVLQSWVIASDTADRQRIREELGRWWDGLDRESRYRATGPELERTGRPMLIDASATTGETLSEQTTPGRDELETRATKCQ